MPTTHADKGTERSRITALQGGLQTPLSLRFDYGADPFGIGQPRVTSMDAITPAAR